MTTALSIEDLVVDVVGKPVLRGVSLELQQGGFAAIFGHNGAGKTTLLRTIMGLARPRGGRVMLDGDDVSHLPTPRIVDRGIGMVPQQRGYFENLTVEDNLNFARRSRSRFDRDEVFELFPPLHIRRRQVVGTMSGGERQMVAVANALMSGPRLLLLDEPATGLAPRVTDNMMRVIAKLNQEYGVSVLLVEQNVQKAARLADFVYVLNQGRVAYQGSGASALERSVWELV